MEKIRVSIFALVLAIMFALVGPVRAATNSTTNRTNNADSPVVSMDEDLFEGFIYYADSREMFLKSIKRAFSSILDSHNLALEIINTLIQGPGSQRLKSTWPKGVVVNSFFITDDKKAYVDLNLTPEMVSYMDTQAELLAIYSLVNSLTVNIPKIKKVKILINGKDAVTLAGHIDLEHFYQTNMLIVK